MADGIPEIDLAALGSHLISDLSPNDCMLLAGLEGFLTGIVVGPEPVSPSDWLPVIWGGEEPKFESMQQRQTTLGTIMGRYHEIAACFITDPDAPIFSETPQGDRIVTDWAGGFLDAVEVRRKAWEPLFRHRPANILPTPLLIPGDREGFADEQVMTSVAAGCAADMARNESRSA